MYAVILKGDSVELKKIKTEHYGVVQPRWQLSLLFLCNEK